MSDYKSERTKKIEKSKVDDDMPAVKKAVRGAFLGLSRASDKVEGIFKKKEEKKENGEKKMQKGGLSSNKQAPKKAATGMLVIPVKMSSKAPAKKKK